MTYDITSFAQARVVSKEVLTEANNKNIHKNQRHFANDENRHIGPDSTKESAHLKKADESKAKGDMYAHHLHMQEHHYQVAAKLQGHVDTADSNHEALGHLHKMYAHEASADHHGAEASKHHPDWTHHAEEAVKAQKHVDGAKNLLRSDKGLVVGHYERKVAHHLGKVKELHGKAN